MKSVNLRTPTFQLIPLDLVKPLVQFRKDLGDLEKLKADILDTGGLLEPIGLNQNYEIVFGERRYRAYLDLAKVHPKFKAIPAMLRRYDSRLEEIHHGNIENLSRKSLTPSEELLVWAWEKENAVALKTVREVGRPKKLRMSDVIPPRGVEKELSHREIINSPVIPMSSFSQRMHELTGIPISTIARKTRLGELSDTSTLKAIDAEEISQTQATLLVALPKVIQAEVLPAIKDLTLEETKGVIRQVEEAIKDKNPSYWPDFKLTEIKRPKRSEHKVSGVNVDTWISDLHRESGMVSAKLHLAIAGKVWELSDIHGPTFIGQMYFLFMDMEKYRSQIEEYVKNKGKLPLEKEVSNG